MALADYQALVPQLVRDDSGKIANTDRDTAIDLAAKRYSKDRPRQLVADAVSAGGALLDLPAAWDADQSAIVSIEYPVGDAPPVLLNAEDYRLYVTPTGTKIQLDGGLSAGDTVRLTYTVPHTLDAGTDTIPVKDREPVSCWAAALLCDQLASEFSGQSLSTIPADSVDHGGRAKEYAQRAQTLRQRYFNELGIDPKRNVPAGATAQMVLTNTRGSKETLAHPLRLFR